MIYLDGQPINAITAIFYVVANAERKGYDPEDAESMLRQALDGAEDFNDQLVCDFGIEVLA